MDHAFLYFVLLNQNILLQWLFEEHSIIGGLGSAVSEVVCEERPVPVIRIGVNDKFGESGKPDELLRAYGLTSENVVSACKKVIG